jgi:hypothetical protein
MAISNIDFVVKNGIQVAGTDGILFNSTGGGVSDSEGRLRYDFTNHRFEGYSGSTLAWSPVGGATLSDDTSTSATYYPTFATVSSGVATSLKLSSTKLTFNPNTGNLTSSLFNGLTITANGSNALNIATGKTFTANNSITLTGTDSTVMTFPSTSATIARTDAAQTFTGVQTFGTDIIVTGNLTVNGTTSTINTATYTVDDNNIELNAVASPTDANASGGGITVKGSTDKTISWGSTNGWTSSEDINLAFGKVFRLNGQAVLSQANLGTSIVSSSLQSVGTINNGTWNANFGVVSGANLTNLTAANLTGTIPGAVLGNSTVYIGTTAIALNRTTTAQTLTGISIDGTAGSVAGTSITGQVPITAGGTGASSASNALDNLLPAAGRTPGYVLSTSGSSFSWIAAGGGGGSSTQGTSIVTTRKFTTAGASQTYYPAIYAYAPGVSQTKVFINGVRQFDSEYSETYKSATITQVARTGFVVTVTTSAAHGLIAGDYAYMVVTTNATCSASYVPITFIDATHFSYTCATTGSITLVADTGTVKAYAVTLNTAPGTGSVVMVEVDGFNSYTQLASLTEVTPVGNIAAVTVQTALQELDSEKLAIAGGTLSGSLQLATGTTAIAPLRFASGTNLTAASAGAVEWNGTNLFITQSAGPTRKTLAYVDDVHFIGTTSVALNRTSSAIALTGITSVNGLGITSSTGTLTIGTGSTLATSGAFSITLTATAATDVTLPTSGTLATVGGNIGAATGTSFNSITGLASVEPLINGTAAVGTSTLTARQDHVHPTDTSRAAVGQTMFIGTTSVAINRASATLDLTGCTVGSVDIGYRNVPQNIQSVDYTLALADNGKHVYSANTGAQTITVPTNASVAFPIGTAISIVNNGTTAITFTTTSLTVYKAGTSAAWASGGTMEIRGMATLMKVDTDTWFISGAGLS